MICICLVRFSLIRICAEQNSFSFRTDRVAFRVRKGHEVIQQEQKVKSHQRKTLDVPYFLKMNLLSRLESHWPQTLIRRLERLTYHQQINCKLILRLRNGKEQKGGLLGIRKQKKGHRSRLAGHLSRRSPQPDKLELEFLNFQSINSKEESPLMRT